MLGSHRCLADQQRGSNGEPCLWFIVARFETTKSNTLGTGGGMRIDHDDASRIRRVIDIDIASCGRRSGDLSPPRAVANVRNSTRATWTLSPQNT
jgi:hypothetical protein